MTTTYTRRNLFTRTAATLLAVTLTLTLPAVGTAADTPKRTPPDIDAKWKPLADEYSQVLRMEALAALANKSDPKKYPLPAPTPFQKAVMAMADKAKPEVRKKALGRAAQTIALPANQLNAQFSRIAGVTPNGKISVQVQYEKLVAGRKSLISRSMLVAVAGGDIANEVSVLRKASAGSPPPNAVKTLRLELVEFYVADDTTGLGDDEVRVGGTALKVNGKTGVVNSFFLGSFSDKQKKTYNPPKKLCDFDLTLTNKYPKQGAFVLMLAEEDWGGTHQDAIEAITDLVKKELDGYAEDAGKALADLLKSEEFGEIMGEVAGNVFDAVIDAVFGWLADFFEDDLFVPIRIPFKVTKPEVWANGATHGADKNYWVKGHGGHYKFKVRWAKVN